MIALQQPLISKHFLNTERLAIEQWITAFVKRKEFEEILVETKNN